MTRVFIMAQGKQSRMHHLAIRKQLLEVGGEPLIGRQIRQVRERYHEPTVVAWADFAPVVEKMYRARIHQLRYAGNCILDGMHATSPWWQDEADIFLLGDVVFSNAMMDSIFACKHDANFWGTGDVGAATGELFAFAMRGREAVNATAELLLIAPCRGARTTSGQGGHLRNLLWLWMQYKGLHPCLPLQYHEDVMTVVSDWTHDIDTDRQVEELLPELDAHVREERLANC